MISNFININKRGRDDKKTLFIIIMIILNISNVACERKNIVEAPTPTVLPATVEAKKISVPLEEFYSINKNEDGTYTIKLFDKNKEVVDESTVPKESLVNKLENDIIQVIISYGSPFYTTYFYDTRTSVISQVYDTPVLIDKGKIVLVQNKS